MNTHHRNVAGARTTRAILVAALALAVLPAIAAEPASRTLDDASAIDAFFDRPFVTLTLSPDHYVADLDEVMVPVRLENGSVLRVEIPWSDPAALDGGPTVTIFPADLTDFAGRMSNDEEIVTIARPVGAHVADRQRSTLCGNRKIAALGLVESDAGTEETQIGFVFEPEASDAAARAVAGGIGCPLLASNRLCKTHKYCEVRIGIPPFTIGVSGRCYPGPWPLGKLCRCWLLAPDEAEPAPKGF